MNTKNSLLLGVALHGASFVLVFITAQILSEPSIDSRGPRGRRRC